MGWNDNKTGEQSNGLKVEVAIFILLIIGAIVIIGFWLGVGWPDDLQDNFANLLTVEAVKEYLDYKERLRSARLQFLTTIAASLGAIGVVFNLYYTGKREEAFNKSAIAANKSAEAALENAKAAQDKQITERFTKAVEQLASTEIAIRLGGIYALERIAKNSEYDHWTIMEVLTAFVREKRPLEEQLPKIPTDIQAALTVIGRRDTEKDIENEILNLRNTNLRGATFRYAKLQRIDFSGADLQRANFQGAELGWVVCNKAQPTILGRRTDHIEGVLYQPVDFRGAHLKNAFLVDANLRGAYLQGANLEGAKLNIADLEKVQFSEANLRGTYLLGAKNLTQQQIESASGDSTTVLPNNLTIPEKWKQSE